MPIPTVSDFLPPACIAGTGEGDSIGLCSYACGYGYCPINKVVSMLDGSQFGLQITCNFTAKPCTGSTPDIAFMNAGRKTMNICPGFFQNSKIAAMFDKFQNPPASIIDAHHARSAVLLHEITHSKFAMSPVHSPQAKDFAYGWESCKLLAEGTFNRGCQPYAGLKGNLCADPSDPTKDGVCNADFSKTNADTWAVVAAGIFFSENVGTEVQLVRPTLCLLKLFLSCRQQQLRGVYSITLLCLITGVHSKSMVWFHLGIPLRQEWTPGQQRQTSVV